MTVKQRLLIRAMYDSTGIYSAHPTYVQDMGNWYNVEWRGRTYEVPKLNSDRIELVNRQIFHRELIYLADTITQLRQAVERYKELITDGK